MCKYHGTHSHKTEDCRPLREEVSRLFNNGHLREFLSDRAKNHFRNRDSNKQIKQNEPQHVINMIIGGVDVPQGPMLKRIKVSIIREKWTRDYVPEGTMSFNDEDVEGIVQPHNDALVIAILKNKSPVKRVLIDPVRVLNGFSMACETIKGEITLPVNVAWTIKKAKFYVIEEDMRRDKKSLRRTTSCEGDVRGRQGGLGICTYNDKRFGFVRQARRQIAITYIDPDLTREAGEQ
nr:uncharacterized protein LOC104121680 [Nicotiana tomentosiformis]